MQIDYKKCWSPELQREIEWKTYGTEGHPIVVFPCQDGRFYDYENFKMFDVLWPFIEEGRCRFICVDGIDWESWTAAGDCRPRIEQHERWFWSIINQVLPRERKYEGEMFATTGCSMGAFHAANFFFRRPDLFDGVIAQSGCYSARPFMGDYCDELVYINSPIYSIRGLAPDHYYIDTYRHRQIFVCIGQGRWEDELLVETRELDTVLAEKGIPAHFEYWGYDVDHDWPWWKKQLPILLHKMLCNFGQ